MLATLADLKLYLDIPAANTTGDTELTRLLNMASAYVEQYLARTLTSATFTERRSGACTDVLSVRNAPITAVTSLTIDGTAIAASDGTTGYYFEGESVYLLGPQKFTRGRKNILLVYTGGYDPSAIPADIVHSVIEIAAQAYREKEWIGFTSKSLAGETVAFARSGLPESAKNALNPYRRLYACD
jgi:hypothetical protein